MTWFLPFSLLLVSCGPGEAGGPESEAVSPWDPPPSCDQLYALDFQPLGGDAVGEWIPVKLCSRVWAKVRHSVETCGDNGGTDQVTERLADLDSFSIGADGKCEQRGTGLTRLNTHVLPFEGCAAPGRDPSDWCSLRGSEGFGDPENDLVIGPTTCVPEVETESCVCTREDTYGPRWINGWYWCEVTPTTMVRGDPGLEEEFAYTVEGDYLIRKLLRYPTLAPPLPNGDPPEVEWGFEIYRRAPAP